MITVENVSMFAQRYQRYFDMLLPRYIDAVHADLQHLLRLAREVIRENGGDIAVFDNADDRGGGAGVLPP